MILVTKVIGGCVSSQRIEIVILFFLSQKESIKLLVLVEIQNYKVNNMKTFYLEKFFLWDN